MIGSGMREDLVQHTLITDSGEHLAAAGKNAVTSETLQQQWNLPLAISDPNETVPDSLRPHPTRDHNNRVRDPRTAYPCLVGRVPAINERTPAPGSGEAASPTQ